MPQAPCLKVPRSLGEKAFIFVNKLGLTDKKLKIESNQQTLCIPLLRQPSEDELTALKAEFANMQVVSGDFVEKPGKEKTFFEILGNQLPPYLLASLPHALDIVGDIAVVEVPPELQSHKQAIGKAILQAHKNVRVVLAKAGAISGTYRVRDYEFIAGEHRTSTVYKEYGCTYHVDLSKAYFSPRLSHEHQRVAALVQPGETVVDLFAGVGPFAILIAKNQPDIKVYAVDINADAIELLKKNARVNRVDNRVYPVVGDARQIVSQKLAGKADRVIMNLPETAAEFVDVACKALKPSGGVVHFYGFVRLPQTIDDMKKAFSEAVEGCDRKVVEFLYTGTVRETAPYECQAVLDAQVS